MGVGRLLDEEPKRSELFLDALARSDLVLERGVALSHGRQSPRRGSEAVCSQNCSSCRAIRSKPSRPFGFVM